MPAGMSLISRAAAPPTRGPQRASALGARPRAYQSTQTPPGIVRTALCPDARALSLTQGRCHSVMAGEWAGRIRPHGPAIHHFALRALQMVGARPLAFAEAGSA